MAESERRHHHPRWELVIQSRTRLVGTLNLAVALRGKSCGWGTCERPRRTFLGFHRGSAPAFHRAIEVIWENDPTRCGMGKRRQLLRIPLGNGKTTWRFQSKQPTPMTPLPPMPPLRTARRTNEETDRDC